MKRKLGINALCLVETSELEALPLIKAAGFESIFIMAYQAEEVKAIKESADELGLKIEFIHAPFERINEMWLPGYDYHFIFDKMKESIDTAAEFEIPQVVIHLSSGWRAPQICDVGLERFDALVRYAKDMGVRLAIENLRAVGNVAYFTDRYAGEEMVSFCYDCGHENCYTKTVSWLDIFTNRVSCTHIHDNVSHPLEERVGNPDRHLLPFDGTCNYDRMMEKLNLYGYEDTLMLEVTHDREEYSHLTSEEFLKTAYDRLLRLSEM